MTGLSTPRSMLITAGVSNAATPNTPPILTSTPAQSLDQQHQFKPLTNIVEAAGLSQVVANLTAGIFSSQTGGAKLPPSLVPVTLTQIGSASGVAMQASSSISPATQSMSLGSNIESAGSAAGVTTDVTNVDKSNFSQVQSVFDNSSTLTVSSSI